MGLLDYIIAGAIAQGSHTGGHFKEANEQGIPIGLDLKTIGEQWNAKDKRSDSQIHGAGFKTQDELKDMLSENPEMQKRVAIINALLKSLYIADAPIKAFGGNWQYQGDVKEMENLSGNKGVRGLLALSILSDLQKYRDPEIKGSLNFTTIDGAPGLLYKRQF